MKKVLILGLIILCLVLAKGKDKNDKKEYLPIEETEKWLKSEIANIWKGWETNVIFSYEKELESWLIGIAILGSYDKTTKEMFICNACYYTAKITRMIKEKTHSVVIVAFDATYKIETKYCRKAYPIEGDSDFDIIWDNLKKVKL